METQTVYPVTILYTKVPSKMQVPLRIESGSLFTICEAFNTDRGKTEVSMQLVILDLDETLMHSSREWIGRRNF
jgi:hypothetical protein